MLPKPKHEDTACHCGLEEEGYACENCRDFTYKERDYYKAVADHHEKRAERAIEALKKINLVATDQFVSKIASQALADIAATDTGERDG